MARLATVDFTRYVSSRIEIILHTIGIKVTEFHHKEWMMLLLRRVCVLINQPELLEHLRIQTGAASYLKVLK